MRSKFLPAAGLASLLLVTSAATRVVAAVPADTLYGSGGTAIVTLDQHDGSLTSLAPQSMSFTGLAFDSTGRLFATGCSSPPCWPPGSLLLELDPVTGAILDTLGTVTDVAGLQPDIYALAVQPGTDVLYGFGRLVPYDSSFRTRIWTIDPATALATVIASEVPAGCEPAACSRYLGFDFAPDGTLYHGTRSAGPPFGDALLTLDPTTGAELDSVAVPRGAWGSNLGSTGPALAVRSDGTLFTMSVFRVDRCFPPCPPPMTVLSTTDPLTGDSARVGADQGTGGLDLAFSPIVVISVDIDIVPGSAVNAVNPMSRGVVPVAILGSEGFDVADVDVTTLGFGPDAASLAHRKGHHPRDVNHDGFEDLLSHFATSDAGIAFGATEACLTGELLDGTPFEGCDSIATLPPGCGEGFGLALVIPVLVTLRRRVRGFESIAAGRFLGPRDRD